MDSYFIATSGDVRLTVALPLLSKHAGVSKLYWRGRSPAVVQDDEGQLMSVNKQIFIRDSLLLKDIVDDPIEACSRMVSLSSSVGLPVWLMKCRSWFVSLAGGHAVAR